MRLPEPQHLEKCIAILRIQFEFNGKKYDEMWFRVCCKADLDRSNQIVSDLENRVSAIGATLKAALTTVNCESVETICQIVAASAPKPTQTSFLNYHMTRIYRHARKDFTPQKNLELNSNTLRYAKYAMIFTEVMDNNHLNNIGFLWLAAGKADDALRILSSAGTDGSFENLCTYNIALANYVLGDINSCLECLSSIIQDSEKEDTECFSLLTPRDHPSDDDKLTVLVASEHSDNGPDSAPLSLLDVARNAFKTINSFVEL